MSQDHFYFPMAMLFFVQLQTWPIFISAQTAKPKFIFFLNRTSLTTRNNNQSSSRHEAFYKDANLAAEHSKKTKFQSKQDRLPEIEIQANGVTSEPNCEYQILSKGPNGTKIVDSQVCVEWWMLEIFRWQSTSLLILTTNTG